MDHSLKPWTVAAARKVLGFSRSGVMKLLKHHRLERFHVHGDTVLITGESMERLLESEKIDARKRTGKPESEYLTLKALRKAAAKRNVKGDA